MTWPCEWCQKQVYERVPVWIKQKQYKCCEACWSRLTIALHVEAGKDKRVSFLFGGNAGAPS